MLLATYSVWVLLVIFDGCVNGKSFETSSTLKPGPTEHRSPIVDVTYDPISLAVERNYCDPNDENSCLNGGNCVGEGEIKFCECMEGTSGDYCNRIDACENGLCGSDDAACAYNVDLSKGECRCKDEEKKFDDRSKTCRSTCDPTATEPCKNGGECLGDGEAKFCNCKLGTFGDDCNIMADCEKRDFCGTGTDVKCKYDAEREKAVCVCDDQTKTFDQKTMTCKTTCDPTATDSCKNGGQCLEDGEKKFCDCKPGTGGDDCSTVVDCGKPDFCGTGKDVRCTYDAKREKAVCECDEKTKAFDQKTKTCKMPCSLHSCKNNGRCIGWPFVEFRFCECMEGTSGDDCGTVDDCLTPEMCGTGTDVYCAYDVVQREAVCLCQDQLKKFDAQDKKCKTVTFPFSIASTTSEYTVVSTSSAVTEADPCTPNPCKGNGRCTVNEWTGKPNCECFTPYFGDFCENDSCTLKPCKNDGICSIDEKTKQFKCDCSYPYFGKFCEKEAFLEDYQSRMMFFTQFMLSIILVIFILWMGFYMLRLHQKRKLTQSC